MPVRSHDDGLKTMLIRGLKFYGVGGLGILVQLAVLGALSGPLAVHYLVATLLAVEAAVVHNFLWHERWTWADRTASNPVSSWRRFVRFNLTTGATSIAGNLVSMSLLVGLVGLHPLLANAITIAACSIANFLVSDRLVFIGPAPTGGGGLRQER